MGGRGGNGVISTSSSFPVFIAQKSFTTAIYFLAVVYYYYYVLVLVHTALTTTMYGSNKIRIVCDKVLLPTHFHL